MARRQEELGVEIGFSIGVGSGESTEIVFLQNIRFAEWLHRERSRTRKMSLRDRLQSLFDALPEEARDLISDDRDALIREIVQTRNVLVHVLEGSDGRRAQGGRLESIVIKLGILLNFHWGFLDYGADLLKDAIPGIRKNPHLMKHLAQSDRVDDGQGRLPGF